MDELKPTIQDVAQPANEYLALFLRACRHTQAVPQTPTFLRVLNLDAAFSQLSRNLGRVLPNIDEHKRRFARHVRKSEFLAGTVINRTRT